MKSLFRNSIIAAVVLFTLAPAAIAGPCPAPPYSVCEPFSVSGVWYSDATKTTVVGGWYFGCPNVNTCLNNQSVWGERTAYSDVDCEPCDPCGNCNFASKSIDGEDDSSCIQEAELQEVEEVDQTIKTEDEGEV